MICSGVFLFFYKSHESMMLLLLWLQKNNIDCPWNKNVCIHPFITWFGWYQHEHELLLLSLSFSSSSFTKAPMYLSFFAFCTFWSFLHLILDWCSYVQGQSTRHDISKSSNTKLFTVVPAWGFSETDKCQSDVEKIEPLCQSEIDELKALSRSGINVQGTINVKGGKMTNSRKSTLN